MMKQYADQRNRTVTTNIKIGDTVLLRKDNKYEKSSTPFHTTPYEVINKKGNMVTCQAGGWKLTRNSIWFRKLLTREKRTEEINQEGDEDDNFFISDDDRGDDDDDNVNPTVRGGNVNPTVERGSSVVECRTRSRESQDSNPLCYRFEVWAFFVLFTTPQSTQLYNWVPGYRQRWTCEWIVVAQLLHG